MSESEAPPLKNFDRFREFAKACGCTVRRVYEPGGEFENEDGEMEYYGPYWQVVLGKEEERDGKVYGHYLTVNDEDVERAWVNQWELLVELSEMGFARVLEKHGMKP